MARFGFKYTDIYSSFGIDVLHQDKNGVSKTVIFTALPALLKHRYKQAGADAKWAAINGRLKGMRPLHEAFMPIECLASPSTQAEEIAGLMVFMAPAMYGLVDDDVVELFANYARFQQLRDLHVHTTGTLRLLQDWTPRSGVCDACRLADWRRCCHQVHMLQTCIPGCMQAGRQHLHSLRRRA